MTSFFRTPTNTSGLDNEIERAEALFQRLGERIARLSLSLELPLHDEQDIEKMLHWHKELTPFDSPLQIREHRELQGLLVLRYHLEKTMAESLGFEKLLEVMTQAESHLRHQGFAAGADGLQLSDFDQSSLEVSSGKPSV